MSEPYDCIEIVEARPNLRNLKAVQVDTLNYDGMCQIIRWVNDNEGIASPVGEDDFEGDAVIVISTHDGIQEAKHGDWIVMLAIGHFKRYTDADFAGVYSVRPEVVVLCGSTRFYEEFQQANYILTMAGKIVLTVGFYPHAPAVHGEGVGVTPEQKEALDVLHKRKIDMADSVYVLNKGGYIGDSTRSEIDYAIRHGKPITWLEELSDELP